MKTTRFYKFLKRLIFGETLHFWYNCDNILRLGEVTRKAAHTQRHSTHGGAKLQVGATDSDQLSYFQHGYTR